jgi:hypothetical protein
MKRLTLALVLCGLVISGTATADQTCKAKANLIRFVKKCETDATAAAGGTTDVR